MVNGSDAVALRPAVSVTVAPIVAEPWDCGAPLSTPAADRLSPAGSPVADQV